MDGLFGAEFNIDISLKKSDLKSKVKKIDSAGEIHINKPVNIRS